MAEDDNCSGISELVKKARHKGESLAKEAFEKYVLPKLAEEFGGKNLENAVAAEILKIQASQDDNRKKDDEIIRICSEAASAARLLKTPSVIDYARIILNLIVKDESEIQSLLGKGNGESFAQYQEKIINHAPAHAEEVNWKKRITFKQLMYSVFEKSKFWVSDNIEAKYLSKLREFISVQGTEKRPIKYVEDKNINPLLEKLTELIVAKKPRNIEFMVSKLNGYIKQNAGRPIDYSAVVASKKEVSLYMLLLKKVGIDIKNYKVVRHIISEKLADSSVFMAENHPKSKQSYFVRNEDKEKALEIIFNAFDEKQTITSEEFSVMNKIASYLGKPAKEKPVFFENSLISLCAFFRTFGVNGEDYKFVVRSLIDKALNQNPIIAQRGSIKKSYYVMNDDKEEALEIIFKELQKNPPRGKKMYSRVMNALASYLQKNADGGASIERRIDAHGLKSCSIKDVNDKDYFIVSKEIKKELGISQSEYSMNISPLVRKTGMAGRIGNSIRVRKSERREFYQRLFNLIESESLSKYKPHYLRAIKKLPWYSKNNGSGTGLSLDNACSRLKEETGIEVQPELMKEAYKILHKRKDWDNDINRNVLEKVYEALARTLSFEGIPSEFIEVCSNRGKDVNKFVVKKDSREIGIPKVIVDNYCR